MQARSQRIAFTIKCAFSLAAAGLLAGQAAQGSIRSGPAQALATIWSHSAREDRPAIVAFSPDGALLATGTRYIRLWRVRNHKLVRMWAPRYPDGLGVVTLKFSPDGKLLASNGGVWEVSTGKLLAFPRESSFIWEHVTFSPDGSLLATATKNGKISVWQLPDGTLRTTLEA
jgi:WD40 repeat protein